MYVKNGDINRNNRMNCDLPVNEFIVVEFDRVSHYHVIFPLHDLKLMAHTCLFIIVQ